MNRSPAGAALLNLTGLAVGYLYLGRRLRAVVYLGVTTAAVATAFLTDAATNPWPWRVCGAYWVAWQAVEVWWLAPRPARRQWVPAALGVTLVAATVAGLLAYGAAARSAYGAGRAAQSTGDCATAMARYDEVTGPYELTLTDTVAAAAAAHEVCRRYAAAAMFAQLNAPAEAVRRLQELATPFDPLLPAIRAKLTDTYVRWAHRNRREHRYIPAIDVYRRLLSDPLALPNVGQVRVELADTYLAEAATFTDTAKVLDNLTLVADKFADTPAAHRLPAEVAKAFAPVAASVATRPCPAVPTLDKFTALPPELLTGIALHPTRAQATMRCGISEFSAGSYASAITMFESFLASYPKDPAAPQALSALIAARVSAESAFSLPLPPPYSGNTPGTINVTFYNDRNQPTHVLLAGATAHEFVLPACPTCPSEYAAGQETCPTLAGLPSVTLRLNAGLYHFITVDDDGSDIATLSDFLQVTPFFDHTMCLFVQRG